jgi:hypothetical protein
MLTVLKAQFLANPSIEGLLRYLSVETWQRIERCRRLHNSIISEVTITENLVDTFRQMDEDGILNIGIMQSTNERVNGNDLEIVINTKESQ